MTRRYTPTQQFVVAPLHPQNLSPLDTSLASLEFSNVMPVTILSVKRAGILATPSLHTNADTQLSAHPDVKLRRPGAIVIPVMENVVEGVLASDVAGLVFYPRDAAVGPLLPVLENDAADVSSYIDFLTQNAVKMLAIGCMPEDAQRYDSMLTTATASLRWMGGEAYKLGFETPTHGKPWRLGVRTRLPRGIVPGGPDPPVNKKKVRLPLSADSVTQYATDRVAGELWVELLHLGENGAVARDAAVFTTAPILFSSNLEAVEVLWAVRTASDWGTTGFLSDLAEHTGGGVTSVTIEAQHTDVWVQDVAMIGYMQTPLATVHVVVPCIRGAELQDQVYRLAVDGAGFTARDIGFVRDLTVNATQEDRKEQMNYGGNVMVSPPIESPTADCWCGDRAGWNVPAHPPAPYGKLIHGDFGPKSIVLTDLREPAAVFRSFLHAQKVQPAVSVDTTWLTVGHVDEILSFVPALRVCPLTGAGTKKWVMLYADGDVAIALLRPAFLTAVREWRSGTDSWYRPSFDTPEGVARKLNEFPRIEDRRHPLDRSKYFQDKLDVILARLRTALALGQDDTAVIRLPVLFQPGVSDPTKDHHSMFPDVVNLLAVGQRVVVPKPWATRVPVQDAAKILDMVFRDLQLGAFDGRAFDPGPLLTERFWYYRDPLTEEDDDDDDDDDVPSTNVKEVPTSPREEVAKALGVEPSSVNVLQQIGKWYSMVVHHKDSVDIFEAYIALRLRWIGLDVRFVDDYRTHHAMGGDIHCGTQARRRPIVPARPWWADFEPFATIPTP